MTEIPAHHSASGRAITSPGPSLAVPPRPPALPSPPPPPPGRPFLVFSAPPTALGPTASSPGPPPAHRPDLRLFRVLRRRRVDRLRFPQPLRLHRVERQFRRATSNLAAGH